GLAGFFGDVVKFLDRNGAALGLNRLAMGGVVAPLGPRRSTCSAGILPARWRAGSPLVNEAGPALVSGGRAVFGGSQICLRQRTFRPPSGRRYAGATRSNCSVGILPARWRA